MKSPCPARSFTVQYLLLVFVLSLFACSKPKPDDQQIMDSLSAMSQAVKNRQNANLMNYLTSDFRGQQRLYKSDMNTLVFYQFRAYKKPGAVLSRVDIKVKDGQASVTAYLLLTGTDAVVPQGGRLLKVESNWRKEKDQWRVFRATWQDVVGEQRSP